MNPVNSVEAWKKEREDANKEIMIHGTRSTKRFFNLDSKVYEDGALPAKTKELLGLVASMVLRCDDCITYHIIQAVLVGTTDNQLYEAFDVALIVGGSIVIPHYRRALQRLKECRKLEKQNPEKLEMQT
jgi:AhpD family alkylhydroperoxidase